MRELKHIRLSFNHARATRTCCHGLLLAMLCAASSLHAAELDQFEPLRKSVFAL